MHLLKISSNSTYTIDDVQYTEQTEIEEVIKTALTNRRNSIIQPPSKSFPIYTVYSDYFQIYPNDLGVVYYDYIKQPLNPIWDFDIVNGAPLFKENGETITNNDSDPLTGEVIATPRLSQSQDFEIGEEEISTLINAICLRLSINIRESDLLQATEIIKQQ